MTASLSSTTTETAALVRRKFAWAVSGTPIRASISDLHSQLRFVGYSLDTKSFERLCNESEAFARVFSALAVRTSKAQADSEINIPAQSRYIVPVEFGPVESLRYQSSLDSCAARHAEAKVHLADMFADAATALGIKDGVLPPLGWQPGNPTVLVCRRACTLSAL